MNESCSCCGLDLPAVRGGGLAGGLLDQRAKLIDVERLDEIIEGALPDRLLAVLDRRVGRDQNDLGGIAVLPGLAKHVQAVDLPFQLQVGHHDIDRLIPQHLHGMLARIHGQGFDGQPAECFYNAVGVVSFVVDHQDDRFVLCPMTTHVTPSYRIAGPGPRESTSSAASQTMDDHNRRSLRPGNQCTEVLYTKPAKFIKRLPQAGGPPKLLQLLPNVVCGDIAIDYLPPAPSSTDLRISETAWI